MKSFSLGDDYVLTLGYSWGPRCARCMGSVVTLGYQGSVMARPQGQNVALSAQRGFFHPLTPRCSTSGIATQTCPFLFFIPGKFHIPSVAPHRTAL